MVGWHHRLDGHGFGWTPGVGDGQGGLGCCSSWGRKESDMTEQLNGTELRAILIPSIHTTRETPERLPRDTQACLNTLKRTLLSIDYKWNSW